ncbi:MAG: radical SAM protein [Candidatus Falkowbacteria bacterium]
MRIAVGKNNIKERDLIREAALLGARDIFFSLGGNDVCFSEVVDGIYPVLDHEADFNVWLVDFPYCVLNEASRDHVLSRNPEAGEKNDQCRVCRYFKQCAGFPKGYFKEFGESEVAPIKDLPLEVMIEAESRCNFRCPFCYNHNSFAKKGRDIKNLTANYVKKIIDGTAAAGIKIIRFTGGEPLLRPDIHNLVRYAKGRGLETRLNTNCSLIDAASVKRFKGALDNVLIPIESFSAAFEANATGREDSLSKKIKAIKLFKDIGVPTVRVGTVAIGNSLKDLDKLSDFIMALPIDEWELYRPISSGQDKLKLSGAEIKKLIYGIIKTREKTGKKITLANALPFCALKDPNKINSVSHGALFDDGHNRIVVDPRGFVKPHYFVDENIGDPLDILGAWNHLFMKKMRNLEFLPEECRECDFRFKCRGGSRFEAFYSAGKWDAPDPLMKRNQASK